MDLGFILGQLDKVEEALKCYICSKQCAKPVRVKVCGHYFCLECFKKKEAHFCPRCNTFYEELEVDYDNIAKQTQNILSDLKRSLLLRDANDVKSVPKNNPPADPSVYLNQNEDVFEYNSRKYHINYIDELYGKINAKGETPLHIACKKQKLEDVRKFIEKKVDLNVKDFAGWAPLHEAIESGSVEIVETLLKHGALIDIPGGEYVTPLHKAVLRGDGQLVRLLLEYGADSGLTDYFGKTPLDYTEKEQIKSILSEDFTCTQRIGEIFCKKNISVYYYYIEDTYREKLTKSKRAKVMREFNAKKVSHFVIRKTHKLSLKILIAMLEGCFLVPQEWIDDFLKYQYFIPIPDYTFISNTRLNKGIRKAIINSLLKLPKLFDGIFFFIYGHNRPVEIHNVNCTKDSISSLICAGGGKVLHRQPTLTSCEEVNNFPYHSNRDSKESRCCHYIIYEEKNPPTLQYQMAEVKHRSSKWLLDCVISFTIH